jgi:ABC-2 type transport system permease protein
MSFWRIVGWDLLILWRSGAAIATVALLLAAALLASRTGLNAQTAHRTAIAEAQALAQASASPSAPGLASPHAVRLRMMAEEPPLLDFAVGRTGLDPILGEATPLTPLHRVFENYQVDNPLRLALVRFDFVFLVTLLAPLLLVALCAGLLGEEQRTGRLALLMAQGARPGRIVLARVTARTLLVVAPLGAALVVQALIGGGFGGARGPAFSVFIGAALLGFIVWAGLCVAVNGLVRQGSNSAVALFAVWLVLAAAGPSAIAAASQAMAPAPSRLAFLADARSAEIAAVKDAESLAQAYLNDHPELEQGGFDVPGWAKSRYVVSHQINEALAPLRSDFDESLGRQMALATALQGLTPTLAQSIAMTDIAGTSALAAFDRQSGARAEMESFRAAMGPAIMGGRGLGAEEVTAWSTRRLAAPSLVAWASLGWLLVWVVLAWGAALIAVRRSQRLD